MPYSRIEIEQALRDQYLETPVHHETHISDVFLVSEFAFKFKKPVQFDFLDFSTLPQRRFACAEEIRLNRRLAPDVYLDLIALVRNSVGSQHITETVSEDSTIIDWGVKMRRLPDDQKMQTMLKDNHLADTHVNRLCDLLVDFYRGLPPADIELEQYQEFFHHHICDNRDTLVQHNEFLDESTRLQIGSIHCRQLEFLAMNASVFQSRFASSGDELHHASGRIVEGHGDLRPDHIYFAPLPVVIDCIEFNREYRTIDIADELSFLAMQLDYLNADAIGKRISDEVLSRLDDSPSQRLLDFYKSYRACVRAKVAVLSAAGSERTARELNIEKAERLIRLASRYASGLGKPVVLLVRGLMGAGKSTLARSMAQRLGATHLQTDAIRKQLFDSDGSDAEYGSQLYSKSNRNRVYEEMMRETNELLTRGISVVLDGTFLKRQLRRRVANLASQHDATFLIANCHCPPQQTIERIRARAEKGKTLSDARPELYHQQQQDEEPMSEYLDFCELDTRQPLESLVTTVAAKLGELTPH